ncbi:MAG: T9SS type A sorting domain-containing protein [candidate division WOR-3 bacterium]|nr:T9SS type A sorting domain-containing protein [candidate division WOR-3 bacterium]MCR4424266.1 T9SS type A sorting domain-containing protein [candidate division WOR-3 bacterium]MDH7519754.1 T9SS type A sorting domain-containing protein [bacterium]
MKGMVAVISLCFLFVPYLSGIPVAGILETGNLTVYGDSIIWYLTSAPGPIVEQTPNWGGDPGTVDTIQFAPKSEWPSRLEMFYRVQGIPSRLEIYPLLPDTWYDLPGYLGFQTPKVRFEDDSISGLYESGSPYRNSLFSITPNPTTSGKVRVNGFPAGINVNLNLYDITGKMVVHKSGLTRQDGLSLDLRALPRGAYIIRVQVNGQEEKQKLLLLN